MTKFIKARQAMMQEQQYIADLLQYIGALTQEGYATEAIKCTQELLATLHSIKRLQKLLDQKRFYCTAIKLNCTGVLIDIVRRDKGCEVSGF